MPVSPRPRARLAAALLAVGVLAACTGEQPPAVPLGPEPTAPTADEVVWEDCGNLPVELVGVAAPRMTYECAEIEVPADWSDPDAGDPVELALIRIHSDRQTDRIGSLVLNPGGPGGSGVDAAIYLSYGAAVGGLPDELTARFDIVGFDPRGVSRSTPVECFDSEGLDATFAAHPDPVTQAEFDESLAVAQELIDACGDAYGDRLRHYSTQQTAHDLDAVRAAVGDETLNYLGYSYGTLLGAVYAHLYPGQIRAMVLDGAIDPTEDPITAAEGQARGFETAFDRFAQWCSATPAECPIAPDARGAVTSAMARAATDPVTDADGRAAEPGWIFWAVVSTLYTQELWPDLAEAIAQLPAGEPAGVFELADSYAQRDPNGTYSNMFEANTAINCADGRADVSVEEVRDLQTRWRQEYPFFGPPLAVGILTCALWPAEPDPYPVGAATGAPPILVIGTVGDPATPYEQAPRLAQQLGVGVLLTYDGEGHGAFPGDGCVDRAVTDYLVDLTVPTDDAARCP